MGVTPPCVHVIFCKSVAYIQSLHAFTYYHKPLPKFPDSVLVLAVAAFLDQMSPPYLPAVLAGIADSACPVSLLELRQTQQKSN